MYYFWSQQAPTCYNLEFWTQAKTHLHMVFGIEFLATETPKTKLLERTQHVREHGFHSYGKSKIYIWANAGLKETKKSSFPKQIELLPNIAFSHD